jgi:hypothetical protein
MYNRIDSLSVLRTPFPEPMDKSDHFDYLQKTKDFQKRFSKFVSLENVLSQIIHDINVM